MIFSPCPIKGGMAKIFYKLFLAALLFPSPVLALELYGIQLESASRDELRAAVKQAGALVIQEAGEADWFDVYDSSAIVEGSSKLFLGFVREDQRFAFAEYEFPGLNAAHLVNRLNARYGKADIRSGRYVSDRGYRWEKDGIQIQLENDWQNYKTRLSYIETENLARLIRERSTPAPDDVEASVSFF